MKVASVIRIQECVCVDIAERAPKQEDANTILNNRIYVRICPRNLTCVCSGTATQQCCRVVVSTSLRRLRSTHVGIFGKLIAWLDSPCGPRCCIDCQSSQATNNRVRIVPIHTLRVFFRIKTIFLLLIGNAAFRTTCVTKICTMCGRNHGEVSRVLAVP